VHGASWQGIYGGGSCSIHVSQEENERKEVAKVLISLPRAHPPKTNFLPTLKEFQGLK
jgi:hypothetical protein